jgi:hypothetical protein
MVQVRLWDAEKGTAVGGVLKGHKQWVTSLAWEPAHLAYPVTRLASASKDCTVRIWDTRLKRCLLVLGVHTKAVSHVKWGGNGLLYTCSQVRVLQRCESCESQRFGFGTARQRVALERWTNPKPQRRARSLRYGVPSCRGKSARVAKRPRERSPTRNP